MSNPVLEQQQIYPTPAYILYHPGIVTAPENKRMSIAASVLAVWPGLMADVQRIWPSVSASDADSTLRFRILDNAVLQRLNQVLGCKETLSTLAAEGYALEAYDRQLSIWAVTERGFRNAVQTLRQLTRTQGGTIRIQNVQILDRPRLPIRGIHLYLPAEEDFAAFMRFADALEALKFNRIYFETAGMEIKSHPEMNEAWEMFATDMMETPEKAKLYQNAFKWQKDSIHVECCGGRTITQDKVRFLLDYCRQRGMDVIPEVQSLSHCHFLTLAHREIAERPEDPYPDTYCPLNDRSYELLFDVIDEVLDVFESDSLNIGHDEVYSIGLCDRCRGKDPAELLALDICRIHDHLSSKGVRTEMWADKLVNAHNSSGRGEGGAFKMIDSYEVSKIFEVRGATHEALMRIPQDILLGNWFWGIYPDGFKRFAAHGFESTYNNFAGPSVAAYAANADLPSVIGGVCSHWSWVREENMARDGFFFNIVYSAEPFWSSVYGEESYCATRDTALAYLPQFFQDVTGMALPSRDPTGCDCLSVFVRHEQHEQYYPGSAAIEVQNFRHTHVEHPINTYHSEVKVYNVPQTFRIGRVMAVADSLIFVHNTDIRLPYRSADHGYRQDDYLLGWYKIHYIDGIIEEVPIYYGNQISSSAVDWGRHRESSTYYRTDIHLQQAAFYTRPSVQVDSRNGAATVYAYEWINPRPEIEIADIMLTANRLAAPFSLFVHDIRSVRRHQP